MLSHTGYTEKLLNDDGTRKKNLEAKKNIMRKMLGLES